jgi:hypothetical protein
MASSRSVNLLPQGKPVAWISRKMRLFERQAKSRVFEDGEKCGRHAANAFKRQTPHLGINA